MNLKQNLKLNDNQVKKHQLGAQKRFRHRRSARRKMPSFTLNPASSSQSFEKKFHPKSVQLQHSVALVQMGFSAITALRESVSFLLCSDKKSQLDSRDHAIVTSPLHNIGAASFHIDGITSRSRSRNLCQCFDIVAILCTF